MDDKNDDMYPLKFKILKLFFFLPHVCVDLGHNNMNLAKLISKIRK